MNVKQRITVLVSGQVQGVGMRQYIQRRARDLSVNGYVENLSDGRVEVVAEGDRDALELLLVRIRMGTAHSAVTGLDVTWGEGGELEDFHVY